jgi:hypothetical protein
MIGNNVINLVCKGTSINDFIRAKIMPIKDLPQQNHLLDGLGEPANLSF